MLAWFISLFKNNKLELSPEKLKADKTLQIIIGLLLIFGLIMLANASSVTAYNTYHDSYFFFKKQFYSIIIGLVFFFLLSKLNYRSLRPMAIIALLASIVFLILVFFPGLGREINGSKSWINFFGFSLQPAEFVKLFFIIFLAALFEKKNEIANHFWFFILSLGIIALLIFKQPDFGTLFIIVLTSFTMYLVGGGKLRHIFWFIVAGLIGLIVMVNLPGQEYQLNRFRCLFDAEQDTQKACYQVNQSLIAIGSGGIMGRGLGESRQKFLYLPEVQNDFIFAVIAEETGLLGAGTIIVLFIILFYRGWIIIYRSKDPYARNLVIGIITWLTGQAILNIGGIANFLPMTGVPLPLISYGGSAIIAVLAGLGIVVNISRYVK